MSKLEKMKRVLEGFSEEGSLSVFATNENREVLSIETNPSGAEEIWNHCCHRFPETGFWPIASWFFAFQHLQIRGLTPEWVLQEICRKGDSFDLAEFVSKQESDWKRRLTGEGYQRNRADRHGEWPMEKKSWYKATPQFTDPPQEDFRILLVEADKPWHVPAVLGMSWISPLQDLNEPEVHVGILKHLHHAYEAELRMAEPQSFLVRTSRRPTTREEAIKLALGLSFYAYDLVDQVVDSFEKLAVTLMSSSDWFFWWD